MSTRLVYEHILIPGVFVTQPAYLVFIYRGELVLGIFGFDLCKERELSNAILCRACDLLQCSMVNPVLNECRGVIREFDDEEAIAVFVYEDTDYAFVLESKKRES